MFGTYKRVALAAVVCGVLSFGTVPASAEHCDTMTVQTHTGTEVPDYGHAGYPNFSTQTYACKGPGEADGVPVPAGPFHHPVSTYLINPGATHAQLIMNEDYPYNSFLVVFNGLGFENATFTANYEPFLSYFSSPWTEIPDGPTASGSITATAIFPDDTTRTVCFHTVDASCSGA